ncbi:PAS domain-containing protein [Hwanghaeella grinnelliae]|uniref:PAS domain-containing protein n=1 Tax=Hwanghaeella grinnelliae TaxID=2500179 RepID=UPI001386EEFE|nr:PAS domain-containing protein [Hwanghaeella grinnelliae]
MGNGLDPDGHDARLLFTPVENADEIQDREQLAIYGYWFGLKGDRPAPDYTDFDVVDVPRGVLPHIFLLEYLQDDADFLHRVVGSEIDEGNGFSASGKKLSAFDAVRKSDLIQTLEKSLFAMRPCFSVSKYYGHDPKGETIHRLSLPLMRDGKPSHLVGVAKITFSGTTNRWTFGPRSQGF